MKNFLLEGHRPGVDWEKQTRVIKAETLAQACLSAENAGVVVVSATYLSERSTLAGVDRLIATNPYLGTPWQTGEPPVS